MSFYDKDKLDKAQSKIRESATPLQRQMLKEADAAFQEVADDFDRRQAVEYQLRQWAEKLCGVKLDFSEIEELRTACQQKRPGSMFQFHVKRGSSVALYKTAFGTVDRVDNYLNTLERTVIDVTNNSQFTALPSSGLIKLAFKRLFKRSK